MVAIVPSKLDGADVMNTFVAFEVSMEQTIIYRSLATSSFSMVFHLLLFVCFFFLFWPLLRHFWLSFEIKCKHCTQLLEVLIRLLYAIRNTSKQILLVFFISLDSRFTFCPAHFDTFSLCTIYSILKTITLTACMPSAAHSQC